MAARDAVLALIAATALLCKSVQAADTLTVHSVRAAGLATGTKTSSYRSIFTVSASASEGQNAIPWVTDPEAVDPQDVCPGYLASAVTVTPGVGLTAYLDLAGPACNLYGNDIRSLALVFEFQGQGCVHVGIGPRFLGPDNSSWYVLSEALVPKPVMAFETAAGQIKINRNDDDENRKGYSYSYGYSCGNNQSSDLAVSWSNSPTFGFSVSRRSTGDVLFSTNGSKLVFEDQFVEFSSALPDNYNLYGLGEVIHAFRLGNNLTRTIFSTDAGDPIDGNIYGSHSIYLDTRYFDQAGKYVDMSQTASNMGTYNLFTHGVFLRNAHAQEVLLAPSSLTWRALGGNIDLYFFSGPTAKEVMQSYQ